MNRILEISKRASKNGRIPIKISLLKIHEDVNEVNLNGLHWNEEYVLNAIDSAKMMPICAEFVDDTKSTPLGHGLTGEELDADGIRNPVFKNSETVGVIESAEIETVQIDNNNVKILAGKGYLYSQRYPDFVKWVRTNYALDKVDTSIEIIGKNENDNKIVYLEDKPTEEYRTPIEFEFSGTAILSLQPSDSNAIVLEIAQKNNKEEKTTMTEQEIMEIVQKTISETNSFKETTKAEMDTKISELNSKLTEKDNTITELNASVEQFQNAYDTLKKEHETYWAEREILEKELAKAKVAAKVGELNEALSVFSEDEQNIANVEINELKVRLDNCSKVEDLDTITSEINSIKSKICTTIVENQKRLEMETKVAEQNSANKPNIDIFSEINSDINTDEDKNIF